MVNNRDYKTLYQRFQKDEQLRNQICGFFFCREKFIKGDVNPKLSHYDKKIVQADKLSSKGGLSKYGLIKQL